MADTLATYAFTDTESYEAAKYKLSNEIGSGWDTGYNNDYWFIYILSDCSNKSRAADICLANGGKSY